MTLTTPVRRTPVPTIPIVRRRRSLIVPGITLPLMAIAMMVSSDYKVRIRPIGQSLSATPDLNTIVEILVYAVVCGILFRQILVTRTTFTAATPLLFLSWLYAAYMCASVAWAVYPPLAVVRGWQFLVTAALAAAIAQLGSRLDLHRLAHLYIYVVSASVLFGTQVHFKRQRLLIHRFNWLHVHPVIAGTYLGLGVVLTLWLVLNRKERPGLPSAPLAVYFVALALLAGGLIGTQTRGALGGCAAGCAVLLLITYRTRLLELVAFGAVGAIVVALLFLGTILTFLARGESSQELTSFNGRTPLWSQAYHLFLQSPLIGYGTTASRGLFWENVHLGGAHNAAVNVIVDGGLIALFLWLAILIGMVRLLRPLLHTPAGAIDVPVIGAALAYLFVNGFTTEGLGYVGNVSSIWLFVLVGWLGILARLALPRFPSHQDEVS